MSAPDLVLGPAPEGVFRSVEKPPQWAFMKMAVAAKKQDKIAQMAAMVDLVTVCVPAEERDRLNDYLLEHDDAVDKLEGALTDLGTYWSGRPLEPSSTSSTASPSTEPEPQLRVVSLSAGTVEMVPMEDGQSGTRAG